MAGGSAQRRVQLSLRIDRSLPPPVPAPSGFAPPPSHQREEKGLELWFEYCITRKITNRTCSGNKKFETLLAPPSPANVPYTWHLASEKWHGIPSVGLGFRPIKLYGLESLSGCTETTRRGSRREGKGREKEREGSNGEGKGLGCPGPPEQRPGLHFMNHSRYCPF